MTIEYQVHKNQYDAEVKGPRVSTHDTEHLDPRAKVALEMMCRWGMVAGSPDGEDSTGRAKLKLESEEEVVERACKMTALAFERFNRDSWITHFPTIETMNGMVKDKELDTA